MNIEWHESLMWCPSQIEGWATIDSQLYFIYLRWRWNDPWTGRISKVTDADKYALHSDDIQIDLSEWTQDSDIKELEKYALEQAIKIIEKGDTK